MKSILLLAFLAIIVVSSCKKENKECPGAVEQTYSITGFSKINAGGSFIVTVIKGNDYSVKATGCANDLADLELEIEPGDILDIRFANYEPNRYRVDLVITLPLLTSLNLSGEAKGIVNGFQGQNSVIRNIVSGDAEVSVNGTGINAQVELSGEAVLNIIGITKSLYGTISGNAHLNAFDVAADEVDISTGGASRAQVHPLNNFFVEASGESRVYYRGNPPGSHTVTSGSGKVIQQ